MAVKVCGTILASLFFDNANSKTDQEGLLLGKVVSKKTNTISDSQISVVKEESFTYIYGHVPGGSGLSWYDNAGRVDIDRLKQMLQTYSPKDVVGWYRFRRCSSLQVSLRERSVHKHLTETFPAVSQAKFVFLLCGRQSTPNNSTHCMEHVLLTRNNKLFCAQQAEVVNLGDTSHNQYKNTASVTTDTGSGDFNNAITHTCRELAGRGESVASVQNMKSLQHNISTKIQSLGAQVSTTESVISQLRSEIGQLESKLRQKELHFQSVFTPLPVPPSSPTRPPLRVSGVDPYPLKRLSTGSSTSPTARKISDSEPDTDWGFDLGKDSCPPEARDLAPITLLDYVQRGGGGGPRVPPQGKGSLIPPPGQDTQVMETDEGPDLINLDPDPPTPPSHPPTLPPSGDNNTPSVPQIDHPIARQAPKYIDSSEVSDFDTSGDSESLLTRSNPFVEDRRKLTNPFYSVGHTQAWQTNPLKTSSPAKTVKEDAFSEFCDNMKSSIQPLHKGGKVHDKGWQGATSENSQRVTRARNKQDSGKIKQSGKTLDNGNTQPHTDSHEPRVEEDILCQTMEEGDETEGGELSKSPVF